MKRFNPGDLNQQIVVQEKTVTYDTVNQPIETWSEFDTVYAQIITSGGGELYTAQRINAETTAVFKIRKLTGITTLMRILYGTRIFEILPPINNMDERNRLMLIMGKEVV